MNLGGCVLVLFCWFMCGGFCWLGLLVFGVCWVGLRCLFGGLRLLCCLVVGVCWLVLFFLFWCCKLLGTSWFGGFDFVIYIGLSGILVCLIVCFAEVGCLRFCVWLCYTVLCFVVWMSCLLLIGLVKGLVWVLFWGFLIGFVILF